MLLNGSGPCLYLCVHVSVCLSVCLFAILGCSLALSHLLSSDLLPSAIDSLLQITSSFHIFFLLKKCLLRNISHIQKYVKCICVV